jgi:hypothetical protein
LPHRRSRVPLGAQATCQHRTGERQGEVRTSRHAQCAAHGGLPTS